MAPPGGSTTGRAVRIVAASNVVVALATAVVATTGGATAAGRCARYPTCLLSAAGWSEAIHTGGAGLLLVLSVLLLGVALRGRRRDPRALPIAAAALGTLLGMAGLGAAFATGVLSARWAPVQFAVLALFLGLDLYLVARRPRRPTGNSSAG